MHGLVSYDPDFLAGSIAQAYDIELEHAWRLGRKAFREITRKACRQQASSSKIRNFSMSLDFSDESWRYILIPVLMASYQFDNKTYRIVINGQTVFESNESALKDVLSDVAFEDRGRAVVLSMFSPPLAGETEQRLDEYVRALREVGFETVDNIRFDGQANIPADERDTMLARLRQRRDLASSDLDGAGYTLKKWLKSSLDKEYSLVVVLAPAAKDSPDEHDTFTSIVAGRYTWESAIEPTTRDIVEGALQAIGEDW